MDKKKISEMTDRELRCFKRRLKKQRILRRRFAVCLFLAAFVFISLFTYQSFKASAKSKDAETNYKYYTCITVAYGDTAWEIADSYIDYNEYKNKDAYLSELRSINHLDADFHLEAGQKLIVPYYSNEYVK